MGPQAHPEMSQVSAHGSEMWKAYQPSRCRIYSPLSTLFIPSVLRLCNTAGVEAQPFHLSTLL